MGKLATYSPLLGSNMLNEAVVNQASEVLRAAEDQPGVTLSINLPSGRQVPLPGELADLVLAVIDDVSHRRRISIRAMPEELSTSVAAAELGISRPTLMKLLGGDEIPSHKVGSHTRVKYSDLVAYKAKREERIRAAADELLLLEEYNEDL